MPRHEFEKKGSDAHQLTPHEARKGGKNSGAKRRENKMMSDIASIIGAAKVTDANAREALASAGVKNGDMTNSALVVFGIFRAAVQGDMKAVEKWQQLTEGLVPQTESTIHIVMDGDVDDLSG